MVKITAFNIIDVRFPTSKELHGSDAMHKAPDYSAAYLEILTTNNTEKGCGLAFTLGRGTEIVVQTIELFKQLVIGKDTDDIYHDFASFWRELVSEDQVRWLGPEKGVTHLAIAAIINALWDLWAKLEKKPLWKLLADMEPEKLVSTIDFTYLSDVLTPSDAIDILKRNSATKKNRENYLLQNGYPAYTTSIGWKGYSDEKIRYLCKEALNNGWKRFKMKVGSNITDDIRRCQVIREEIGYDNILMMDANQVWDVPQAIEHMKQLAVYKPYWIEEPTSPDDVIGHGTIRQAVKEDGIKVATGEACQNRVIFKQFLQHESLDVCQIDTCRVAGVNENLAIIFMAAKYGIPICPHAGGVGLCEMAQHLSMFDFISVSATMENRMTEYVDHLHGHFLNPVVIVGGNYKAPSEPGYGTEMKATTLKDFVHPHGPVWRGINEEL